MLVIPNEAVFAIEENTNAWSGDAVAVGAGDGIEPNPPGALIVPGRTYEENNALRGAAGRLKFDVGSVTPDFSFDHNARYAGKQNALVAGWFGDDSVAAINEGTLQVGSTHTFTIQDRSETHFTLAAGMGTVDILEMDHFKVDTLTLSWTAGTRAVWTFDNMGRRWRNDSSINQAAQINTVTASSNRDHWLSEQLTARIAAQSASTALASTTNDICISSFTLTLSRSLAGPETTCGSPYRDEPFAAVPGWTGTIAFTIPRWETSTLQDAHEAGTLLMMDLVFLGALVTGSTTVNRSATINLPQLQITEYDLVEEGTYGESVTAELTSAEITVAGMTGSPIPHIIIASEDQAAYVA